MISTTCVGVTILSVYLSMLGGHQKRGPVACIRCGTYRRRVVRTKALRRLRRYFGGLLLLCHTTRRGGGPKRRLISQVSRVVKRRLDSLRFSLSSMTTRLCVDPGCLQRLFGRTSKRAFARRLARVQVGRTRQLLSSRDLGVCRMTRHANCTSSQCFSIYCGGC